MSRTVPLLAALAMIALLSAGCANALAETGSGSSTGNNTAAPVENSTGSSDGSNATATAPAQTGSGSGDSNATNRDQAVKFAECMRKNGVREFPDPNASGDFAIDTIANRSGLDTNTAAFKQARSACKDLEPAGFTGNKRSPEQQQAGLKFAQCIRDNGVKDFPDPDPDGPLIDTNRIPSTAQNGGMSVLHAAMQKCRGFASSAGVTGGQ
jgi:hypothetical protein